MKEICLCLNYFIRYHAHSRFVLLHENSNTFSVDSVELAHQIWDGGNRSVRLEVVEEFVLDSDAGPDSPSECLRHERHER